MPKEVKRSSPNKTRRNRGGSSAGTGAGAGAGAARTRSASRSRSPSPTRPVVRTISYYNDKGTLRNIFYDNPKFSNKVRDFLAEMREIRDSGEEIPPKFLRFIIELISEEQKKG
jgi:hypothetical protein